MYMNQEGYPDIMAGKAIRQVSAEERKRDGEVGILITALKQIISLAGFELVGRIELKDRQTGKEYKRFVTNSDTKKRRQ